MKSLLLTLVVLSGCATDQALRAGRTQYLQTHPELAATVKDNIAAGRVVIGMTKEQAQASWGEPFEVNTTHVPGANDEQWVYREKFIYDDAGTLHPKRCYLYFRNGVMTSWQAVDVL